MIEQLPPIPVALGVTLRRLDIGQKFHWYSGMGVTE
jgi:hypothetical protein